MTPIERLQTSLTSLGLKAVEARLENLLDQAAKKEPGYAFLDELLSCEVDARRSRYLRARLQLAHLPFVKTFDQFDFGFQPSIDEKQIRESRSLRFVHEASNVILLGPPGVLGKTHLSVALAEATIQSGFGAYFMTAHDLVADLSGAYREGRLDRRMRVYLWGSIFGDPIIATAIFDRLRKEVWVSERGVNVEVHYGGQRIAVHARAERRHQIITHPR